MGAQHNMKEEWTKRGEMPSIWYVSQAQLCYRKRPWLGQEGVLCEASSWGLNLWDG
jgi:hypothetical protein